MQPASSAHTAARDLVYPALGKELWLSGLEMTKLVEWLLGLSLLGGVWLILTFDLLGVAMPKACWEVVWPLPIYLLVVFGCYSLATVGYRLATFNDCEEAAHELQAQISEAKADLKRLGLRF